jgi:hypothetical protein
MMEDIGGFSSMAGRCRNWWSKATMRKFCLAGFTGSKDQVQKLVHPIKVGVALSLASLFILLKGPDEWLGSNAIWAVMTVVIVFEASVGEQPSSENLILHHKIYTYIFTYML